MNQAVGKKSCGPKSRETFTLTIFFNLEWGRGLSSYSNCPAGDANLVKDILFFLRPTAPANSTKIPPAASCSVPT